MLLVIIRHMRMDRCLECTHPASNAELLHVEEWQPEGIPANMRLCRMQLGKHSFMPNAALQQRKVLLHHSSLLAWATSESHHSVPVGFIGFWDGLQNRHHTHHPSGWHTTSDKVSCAFRAAASVTVVEVCR